MTGNVDAALPDVAGRVAVVTGASRGIGAGMAARFAAHGMALGLCARSEPPAPAEAGGTGAAGRVLTAAVDVTDAAAVEAFAAAVVERFGRIDLWVNNAGVLAPIGPLRDADPDALEAHVRTNVTGVLLGSRAMARHVRSRAGGGALVNVSSGASRSVYPGWAAYGGAKAAVDQLTRVVAAEEADAGLRAVALAPGVVDTDMQAMIRATSEDDFPALERFLELKRDDTFNSPAWVADQLLLHAFGDGPGIGDDVVVRVPDEPRP
jgi:NAD(P)-dependent dehydrogenase (short-subunit alcohol dehydrogenase family)